MPRTVLQRVVWNTAGWRKPTGASNEGGYFADNGFGHEEWNFQVGDAVDGQVLGYMYWYPGNSTIEDSDGEFTVGFWAIHPETKQRMLVGRYQKARLVDDKLAEKVDREYAANGTYDRRAAELRAVVPGLSIKSAFSKVREGFAKRWLRWACPADAVVSYEPADYVPVPNRIGEKGLSLRFAAPSFVNELPTRKGGAPKIGKGSASPLVEDAYYRELGPQLKVIVPLHNKLSNAFAKWLRREGYEDVRQEEFRVDVEFLSNRELCRAELKSCHGVGTTKAIREALGQLFEYNHYGQRTPARRWWVVLDSEPSVADRSYIATLCQKYALPLVLAWPAGDGFERVEGKT